MLMNKLKSGQRQVSSNIQIQNFVVLVKKRDGTPRICIDFRKINKVIVKNRYPLPLIEDQLDRLQNASIFSTIDLKNGVFHVPVAEKSRQYTSFVTHNGQYQFCKVPFGLCNSPGVFQRYVNCIFRDLARRGVALPYIDDVIIPAANETEALCNLEEVMKICKDYGLKINFKKCCFLKKKVEFLGYVIEDQKISPSPCKIEALSKFKPPLTLKQVQSFLGLAGYFRKFIPNFSIIAKPLSDITKQNKKFEMGDQQMFAFNTLKKMLGEHPILSIFNQNYETELHTDVSIDGYGAVLLQISPNDGSLHPVYYMRKKTSQAERKYTSYELEILAVIEALKKFRVYLLGLRFKIVTDCNAFAKTLNKKDLCTRVARQMRHVDALSRYAVMMVDTDDLLMRILQAQQHEDELKALIDILHEKETHNDYFLKGNILHKIVNDVELVVVPRGMQREVIRRVHDKGHFGVRKMKEVISREYLIPKLEEKIKLHIASCIQCIISNRKSGKQEGELHPLPKEDSPLCTYHVDFLGPLESTNKQYRHILAIVDAFTKFCWLYPVKTTSSQEVIKRLEMQSVTFGNPAQIISDRGSAFTSDDFSKYCEDEGIKHFKVTAGLPRANGQVERLNGIIINVLSKLSIEDPTKWYKFVDKVQQIINSTYARSTNTTPFELMTGIKMRTKEDVRIKELIESEMIKQFENGRIELRKRAKEQILKIQNENKRSYNLRRKVANRYSKGDLVAIKRTQFGTGLKLKPKYLGPYQIVNVKYNDTYDVIKVGSCEGPKHTSTCAEYMKPWVSQVEDDEAFGTNAL